MVFRLGAASLAMLIAAIFPHSVSGQVANREPGPDLILHGGRVVTVDSDFRITEAVAIRDGYFAAMGTSEDLLELSGNHTRVLDLQGRTVIPGIIDSHLHAFGMGFNLMKKVNFARPERLSLEEMLATIEEAGEGTPPGDWIVAYGPYSLDWIEEGRLPNRWELDRVTPENPFYMIMHGHDVTVNSRALNRAGIDRHTPDPEGGTIVRDSLGRPTGLLLEEGAFRLVQRLLPDLAYDDKVQAARLAMRKMNSLGITSVLDPDRPIDDSREKIAILHELQEQGELTVRWHILYRFRGTEYADKSYEEIEQAVHDIGAPSGFGNDWIRITGIKLSLDGGVESAYMREPYLEEEFGEGYRGVLLGWDKASLKRVMRAAKKYDVRMFVHCVGDAALDLALDAMDEIDREPGGTIVGRRWTLEHGGVAPTERNLEQARRLGVVVSTQQAMGWTVGKSFKRVWGKELGSNWMPNKTWLDAGVMLKGGSDRRPPDPIIGLWSYVTREDIDGEVSDPDERLTPEEALRLYTINGAYGTFDEDIKGSIEVGKLADLVVLSDDPLTVAPDEIRDIDVIMTIVGGRVVFRQGILQSR